MRPGNGDAASCVVMQAPACQIRCRLSPRLSRRGEAIRGAPYGDPSLVAITTVALGASGNRPQELPYFGVEPLRRFKVALVAEAA